MHSSLQANADGENLKFTPLLKVTLAVTAGYGLINILAASYGYNWTSLELNQFSSTFAFPRGTNAVWYLFALALVYAFSKKNFGEQAALLAAIPLSVDQNLHTACALITADAALCVAILLSIIASSHYIQNRDVRSAGLFAASVLGAVFIKPLTAGICETLVLFAAVVCYRRRSWALVSDIGIVLSGLAVLLFVQTTSGKSATNEKYAWCYLALALTVKTPLLSTLSQAATLTFGLQDLLRHKTKLFLALSALLLLLYFSLVYPSQSSIKDALICLPLLYILAGAFLADLSARIPLTKGWVRALVLAIFFGTTAVELASYFGDPLPFTNILVWPKSEASRFIGGADLNVGQHEQNIRSLVQDEEPNAAFNPPHLLPGRNVFDANLIADAGANVSKHRWIRDNLKPVKHILHTYLVYDVSGESYTRFMNSERLIKKSDTDTAPCRKFTKSFQIAVGDPIILDAVGDRKVLCIRSDEETDVGINVTDKSLSIGRLRKDNTCVTETAQVGEKIWFRTRPGVHAFCVSYDPGLKAHWILGQGQASFLH